MVKHFTKENLGWSSMASFPDCSFKGSDTRLILRWLVAFLGDLQTDDPVELAGFVACKAMDEFLRICFDRKKPLLPKSDGAQCLALLCLWIEKYLACARACYDRGQCFFSIVPKVHYIMHVADDLLVQLSNPELQDVLNPGLFSTQMAEDYVGRTCRIGRTVHPRNLALRSAQKWLVVTKRLWERK